MAEEYVVLYIGVSLVGYIATKEEDLDWLLKIAGYGANGFGDFYATVDSIIMGRKAYDCILAHDGTSPYPDKYCYRAHPAAISALPRSGGRPYHVPEGEI